MTTFRAHLISACWTRRDSLRMQSKDDDDVAFNGRSQVVQEVELSAQTEAVLGFEPPAHADVVQAVIVVMVVVDDSDVA